MFENAEISLEELPAAEKVEWRGLDPSYVTTLQIQALIATATLVAILVALHIVPLPFTSRWPLGIGWAMIVLSGIYTFARPLVSVPKKGYAVRDRDIVYKSGVLWRTVTAIPFNRIQHVETSSTPLDRRFSLATLQLFTAGGSGGDLKIHGLPAKVAESLRLLILEKAGASIEHD